MSWLGKSLSNALAGSIGGGTVSELSNDAYLSSKGQQVASQRGSLGSVSGLDYRLNQHNIDYLRQLELMNNANSFSAKEAQKQRDFEERMSSTAYQRAMSDLKAAGINPALAFSSPASTPSGAYAHGAYSGAPSSSSGAYDAYSSVRQARFNQRQSNYRTALGVLGMLGTQSIRAITAMMI